MDLGDWIRVVGLVVVIVTLLISGMLSIFVVYRFVPKLHLQIEPKLLKNRNGLILMLELENIATVNVPKRSVLLQILKYDHHQKKALSEWVPFSRKDIMRGEEPIEWAEPVEVFTSTTGLHAGEKLSVQRFYQFPADAEILHIGLQYVAQLGPVQKRISGLFSSHEQWTTTIFVPLGDEDAS